MIVFIGDDKPKSSIHRMYESGEEELAIEYLIQGENEDINFMDILANSDERITFLKSHSKDLNAFYRKILPKIYGKNIVAIANMWKVQTITLDKYMPFILEYLYYADVKAKLYEISPMSIAVPAMMYKMNDSTFNPEKIWHPSVRWKMVFTNNPDQNIVSPFNFLIHARLEIHDPPKKFIEVVIPNKEKRENMINEAKEAGLDPIITFPLLPNDNFNMILKMIDCIHRYI